MEYKIEIWIRIWIAIITTIDRTAKFGSKKSIKSQFEYDLDQNLAGGLSNRISLDHVEHSQRYKVREMKEIHRERGEGERERHFPEGKRPSSRVGNSHIGFSSESLVFVSERVINSWKRANCSCRSFVRSDLSKSLMPLFFTERLEPFSHVRSCVISDLSKSLTVAQ